MGGVAHRPHAGLVDPLCCVKQHHKFGSKDKKNKPNPKNITKIKEAQGHKGRRSVAISGTQQTIKHFIGRPVRPTRDVVPAEMGMRSSRGAVRARRFACITSDVRASSNPSSHIHIFDFHSKRFFIPRFFERVCREIEPCNIRGRFPPTRSCNRWCNRDVEFLLPTENAASDR
jgi:hypothetical protein